MNAITSTACLVLTCALSILPAHAQRHKPIPHPIGATRHGRPQPRPGSRWTPLVNQPDFLVNGASNPILMTDGSVLIQETGFPDWWRLTPDAFGSYVNGTWSQVASLPGGYAPLYHSSAVLPDGRLIIEGGEYLLSADHTAYIPTWSAQGAIYDPRRDSWSPVNPPDGWQTIGDAQSVVLSDGTYMQANCCSSEAALLNASALTWTTTGGNKFDVNDEEGWTLLPNGKVLTVDAYVFSYVADGTNSELYNPQAGTWSTGGSTITQLWASAADCGGSANASYEVGPGILRPDRTVFYTGANSCGAAHTSIYDSRTGRWTPGPDFPGAFGIPDGPAALEPNGKVLMLASDTSTSQFFEWNGSTLTAVSNTPNAAAEPSFVGNMLVLPTGQILLTDFSDDVEIYTPTRGASPAWAPVVLDAPDAIQPAGTYTLTGIRLNGMSQGTAYGDDNQAATNYPLIRITNVGSGHVTYATTHDHSSMGVSSEQIVSTHFSVSPGQERGASKLEVVANGIASRPINVLVR